MVIVQIILSVQTNFSWNHKNKEFWKSGAVWWHFNVFLIVQVHLICKNGTNTKHQSKMKPLWQCHHHRMSTYLCELNFSCPCSREHLVQTFAVRRSLLPLRSEVSNTATKMRLNVKHRSSIVMCILDPKILLIPMKNHKPQFLMDCENVTFLCKFVHIDLQCSLEKKITNKYQFQNW